MKALQKNTYTYQVMQWLKLGLPITSRQAIDELGCTRLAAVISHLKSHYSMPISSEKIKVKNRNGRLVEVARYELITEEA